MKIPISIRLVLGLVETKVHDFIFSGFLYLKLHFG